MSRRRFIFPVALALGIAASTAWAQGAYPTKPIRVLVPSTPGAIADLVPRAIGQELATRLGQPWIVENRAGGNHVIAVEACARAAGDGYTLCMVSIDSMSLNPHLIPNLPYDAAKDFKPISNLFYITQGLIGSASLAASSVKELQQLATSKRGALNFSTLGPGTNPDVFRQWLGERLKADITGIPYKGGIVAANAVVSGEVHLSWIGIGNVSGQVAGGKVKILAVNSAKRSRAFPNVPTLDEAGLSGFTEKVWWGLSGPAALPDAAVARLNSEIVRLYREPKFLEFLESRFLEPAAGSPEAFAAFMQADRERAGRAIKAFNVQRQ